MTRIARMVTKNKAIDSAKDRAINLSSGETRSEKANRVKIKSDTEAMQREMGERIAGKRRARQRGTSGLLSSATMGLSEIENQLLG